MRPLNRIWLVLAFLLLLCPLSESPISAQKKKPTKAAPKPQVKAKTELEKLRDEYINATKDYKSSLEKLLPLYEKDLERTTASAIKSKELFAQGLISKHELEVAELAAVQAQAKIDDVKRQMGSADTQIAQVLVEVEAEKEMAKVKHIPKGGLVTTTSFIRFNGAGPWSIAQAGSVDAFFREKFGRPLPIAVLGQGEIHNRWRLDHHNAMDLQLNPNGAEGQVVMDYLRSRGIPFSAFRMAIPGVATGPHIHVGLPSHHY